jgi:hypothetical protein
MREPSIVEKGTQMSGPMTRLVLAAVLVTATVVTIRPAAAAPAFAQAQPKAAAATPKLGTPRLYLIWNDSGAMSQDMASRALAPDGAARKNQIIASDRKLGASLQARLDAVIEAPSGVYDNVTLGIRVISEGKTIVDQKFPVGFVDKAGRLIRAVIVNHECRPFDVELTLGSAKRTMKVDLTCGG